MEALLNLTPLHILIKYEGIITCDRLARNKKHQLRVTDHSRNWSRTIEDSPSINMPSDNIIRTFRFDKNFNTYVPSREAWQNGVLPPEHGVVLYTDGSVINESAGAGIYCELLKEEISIPLGLHPSIFLAELRAIIESCHTISEHKIKDEIIFICTDSQAAIKALSSVMFSSALALESWDKLNYIASTNRVDLIWVPGHSKIEGNEKADELAKKAALNKTIGPEPILAVPYSKVKRFIKEKMAKETYLQWINSKGNRQAKNCISINKKRSKFLLNISRTRLKTYTEFVTGHYGFNKHLKAIG